MFSGYGRKVTNSLMAANLAVYLATRLDHRLLMQMVQVRLLTSVEVFGSVSDCMVDCGCVEHGYCLCYIILRQTTRQWSVVFGEVTYFGHASPTCVHDACVELGSDPQQLGVEVVGSVC